MLIDHFLKRGQKFLSCRYPIMCGAMTWVSEPSLVAAVGNAGAFGLLAGGNAPVGILKDQIIDTQDDRCPLRGEYHYPGAGLQRSLGSCLRHGM